MSKILLINPSYSGTYASTKVGMISPVMPTMGLTAIAAQALSRGHEVKILDLSYSPYNWSLVKTMIVEYTPDIVGITATTPLMNQLRDISVLCKDISKNILVVGGGAHISALPYESMKESMLDMALPGEADFTFADVADGMAPRDIQGLYYRDSTGNIVYTGPRPLIQNLDDLPMPAWHLYDPAFYRKKVSYLYARRPPLITAEFSRGCVYKCDFCASKLTKALGYRKKSPKRCAEEVKLMKKLGWNEFMLVDDIFTTDNRWAQSVSEEIIQTEVNILWTCTNGIRVESVDDHLFRTMRKAGCYRVAFGFESGNDEVLKEFGKGGSVSIEQGRKAVLTARSTGVETFGYFLLGLSSDNKDTMLDTIDYAISLGLDMLKFSITIPFPGTKMYNDYVKRGLIRSYNWDKYHIYTDEYLFTHPELRYEDVLEFTNISFRRAIITNPRFIFRRIIRGIRTGEFFRDAYSFPQFLLKSTVSSLHEKAYSYYVRSRWPQYNFEANPPRVTEYQIVKKVRFNNMRDDSSHKLLKYGDI